MDDLSTATSAAAASTAAATSNNNTDADADADAVEKAAPTAANGAADSACSLQQCSSGEYVSAAQPTQSTAGTSAAAAAAGGKSRSRKKSKHLYKCNIKGCKLGENQTPMDACSASELEGKHKCTKAIHYQCWTHIVAKNKVEPAELVGDMGGKGFCTIKCYRAYVQEGAGGMMWNNDGKNGKNDPNCSENLLVKLCLTNPQLWQRYKNPYPKTKNDICQEFADMINAKGVRVKRTAHQVRGKIDDLEAKFRNALDFADTQTGIGLQENDPDNWEHAILLRCKFYHELHPVWIDRASMRPLMTTEDMLNYNSDDSSLNSSDDDDSDDDASSSPQQKKKGKQNDITDLCFSGDNEDDDNDDEEEEDGKDQSGAAMSVQKKKAGKKSGEGNETTDLTMSDDEEGNERSSAAASAQKKKPGRKKKSSEGKTKTTKKKTKKTPKPKPPPKPKTPTTDDLLRKLVELKTEQMEAKKKKRKQREAREEARRKRVRVEDFDLTNFQEYMELTRKFKQLCDCVGGDKVQVCMQFPKFAETNLLTDEEKREFRERQQQQNLV